MKSLRPVVWKSGVIISADGINHGDAEMTKVFNIESSDASDHA